MAIVNSQLRKINAAKNINTVQAQFLYPKMVLFEGTDIVRLIDIKNKTEDQDQIIQVEQQISDKTLQEHILWLVLSSGEVMVIDVLKGSKLKIVIDNYENYKINQVNYSGCNIFLISEGGECLTVPYTLEDLTTVINEGTEQLNMSLQKANIRRAALPSKACQIVTNGLYTYIEDGKLLMKCPITDLVHTIQTETKLNYLLSFGDATVLSAKSCMWIVDLKDAQVLYEFSGEENYYPVATFNDLLYYLVWNDEQIRVCCAWNTSLNGDQQDRIDLDKSTSKLSSQETLKLQLENLMDTILTTDNIKQDEVLAQLSSYFEQINDNLFLIKNATTLCQHNIMYKSLLYPLQKRVFESAEIELIAMLNDLIIKVDLLEYITFRGSNCYENVNLFEKSFIQLCVTFISKSDLDLASICWLKYSEMNLSVNTNDVLDILNAVPHNLKMGALSIWLRNLLPTLLDDNPFYIDLIVKWTTERVFLLEQSNYWPKIGIKFIEEIITILETSLKTISIRPISIDDLDMLKNHINYIIELKEKYKINMLLSELSSQTSSEVALIMLRRCYTEDLDGFLQDYLPSYAARHLFDLDDTLRSFIESEAAVSGGGVDGARLEILLRAFQSTTTKLDCLLQVLKVLDVPWSTAVVDVAVAAAASATKDFTVTDADKALAHEIQKELNYANVKVILKKYNFPLTCTDYVLVLHKIISSPMVNLKDLKVITSVMAAYTNYGSVLYIDRCLQDCDTRIALEFFNNLEYKEKKILLKTIMTKYEQIINKDASSVITERNYLDFLKGSQMLTEIEVSDLENLYHLKNSYNLSLPVNNLYNEKTCANAASTWICSEGASASSGRGGCIAQLTRTHQSRSSKLIALLRRTSTSNRVRKFVENLISSHSSNNSSESLLHFKDGQNSSLLVESCNILVELITSCNEEHIHYLMKYVSILNALINANIVIQNLSIVWKFHYIFLPMSSIIAANDLIHFYEAKDTEKSLETDFINICNRSDFIPFRIISKSLEDYAADGVSLREDIFAIRDRAAKKLLTKMIASQNIDEVLITLLLLILNGVEEIDDKMWIVETLRGHNDTLSPALMCYLSSTVIRRAFLLDDSVSGNTISYPPQCVLKSKFNINLSEISLPDNTDETWDVKVLLFYVLRQHPDTPFDRLVDLCRTLNVSVNDGLSLQLISILSTWELKYKIYNDDIGCRQIYLENNENELISKSVIIWESIDDKEFLKDILTDFWKNGEVTLHGRLVSINPYYYEVYLCLHHLIYGASFELRNIREYFLLNFLKMYKRKGAPKQYEFEMFSVKGMFPEIGHYRLPFHLFMREDMWSNLKSEITLETYESWLPAVALLSLDEDLQIAKDMLCSNALKQTMTSRKRNENSESKSKESEPWRLTTREEPLLRAAHRCVRYVANMEWAGACLFYVLQGCCRGADQVAAAHLCYQFAQRWAALQPDNRAVRQMDRLHSTLSTRHALHKIEWACEEFIRLTAEPSQLIRALYLHPMFVEKMARHDVNRAANDIADKNGINISSIRIQILENILEKSSKDNKDKGFCALNSRELMTAKYILKATCPKMGAIYLSRIAFDDDSDFNKAKKLRALQCLISVVDPDTVMKVTNKERNALWKSLLELLCVVKLENIDMPWIVATFLQNKIRALEQLLQATGNNTEGLKLAAELSRRFGSTQLIRELIPLLLRASLYEEIIPLLLKMSAPPDALICTAWRAIILSPFQRADYPITERQRAKCLNAINLLPVCPIIRDEDLMEIWKNCVRCKCLGIGCLVLPYMTSQTRQSLNELHKIDRRNLIASLKNLHAETYLVSGAMHVIESMASRAYKRR